MQYLAGADRNQPMLLPMTVEEYVSAKAGVPLVVARGESEALACHLDDLKKICTDAGIVFTIHPTG